MRSFLNLNLITISSIYAFMQAVGMVDDHLVDCPKKAS
ncbi:DNA-3-methyladenine glycosylase I [Vibrio orientalis]|nr:DNA-3-methyladenine glycosylase I [Vibrio orientalis]